MFIEYWFPMVWLLTFRSVTSNWRNIWIWTASKYASSFHFLLCWTCCCCYRRVSVNSVFFFLFIIIQGRWSTVWIKKRFDKDNGALKLRPWYFSCAVSGKVEVPFCAYFIRSNEGNVKNRVKHLTKRGWLGLYHPVILTIVVPTILHALWGRSMLGFIYD